MRGKQVLLNVIAIITIAAEAQVSSNPAFLVQPGPFAVGEKVVEQYDPSRFFRPTSNPRTGPSTQEPKRPLQTVVWYPAKASILRAMTVGDYIELARTETTFGHPEETATTKEWETFFGSAMAGAMRAKRDAPEAEGRFPLVVYSPSFSSVAWENADLCEYLHGNTGT